MIEVIFVEASLLEGRAPPPPPSRDGVRGFGFGISISGFDFLISHLRVLVANSISGGHRVQRPFGNHVAVNLPGAVELRAPKVCVGNDVTFRDSTVRQCRV